MSREGPRQHKSRMRATEVDQAAGSRLRAIRIIHTIIWVFFVACIVAIYVAAFAGWHHLAFLFAAIVLIEVAVLLFNRMSCPLTAVAARYTESREPNFDIYLPRWVARHNKLIFGTLYAAGVATALLLWVTSR